MPANKRGLATPASSKTPAAASAAASLSIAAKDASPEAPAQKRRRSARLQQKQDLDAPIEQSKAGAPPSKAVTSSSKTPSTSRSADPKPATQPKAPKTQAKEAVTATTTTGKATTSTTAAKKAAHPSPATGATAQTDVHVQLAVPKTGGSASSNDSPPSSESTPSYWLLKSEPESRIEMGKDLKFSIDDLAACKEPAGWDGVRNYAARNNLRAMKKGDLAFFYHSNCKEPGIAGIMEIAEGASIDNSAFNPIDPYFDPKSERSNPKWYLVKVKFVRKFARLIRLHELKSYAGPGGELANMALIKMSRLSVSLVGKAEWDFILSLENKSP